jgi:hypothetical protein
MDDAEWKERVAEIDKVMREFDKMLRAWEKRDADPSVVFSIGLVRFSALSGSLFETDLEYKMFLGKCLSQGYELFKAEQEEDEGPQYVH